MRKPKYSRERALLSDAIALGDLDGKENLRDCASRVEKIIGWDSILDGGDWIELEMEANERDLQLNTVEDFMKLLTAIDL